MSAALEFEINWLDPGAIQGRELAATYAGLRLRVDDRIVTRLVDRQSASVRDVLYLPLYPLAEWIAFHWWPLLHEPENVARTGETFYRQRHDLRFGREGYAFPSLRFMPSGPTMTVAWGGWGEGQQPVEFTGQGSAVLEGSAVESGFGDFVQTVIARLEARGVTDTPLQEEWAALWRLDDEERAFCRAAGLLGVQPFALSDDQRQAIVDSYRNVPMEIADDFFAAASLEALPSATRQVQEALMAARRHAEQDRLGSLRELRADLRADLMALTLADHRSPWSLGYARARLLRRRLGITAPIASDEALARALGIANVSLWIPALTLDSSDLRLDGAMISSDDWGPGFALRPGPEMGQRFAFCRLLADYLGQTSAGASLATPSSAARQAENRSFAAEFLAPARGLEEYPQASLADETELERIAEVFGVSPFVVAHQVRNHGLTDRIVALKGGS